MALLHNTMRLSALIGRRMAGTEAQLPMSGMVRTDRRCWYAGHHAPDRKSGVIDGARPPSTWMMGMTAGAMASRNIISGSGSQASAITGGVNGQAALAGAGDITSATAQLVISMVATLAGSGTVADADLRGYLNAVATLTGSGDITAAIAALGWLGAATSGSGTISSATPYATGTLAATIRGYSDLTPEGLRDLVWNATAASYTTSGTMGQKVNSAASGGVDLNALAAAVWQYVDRTITENPGVTAAELVSALNATTIPVDIAKVNGVTVSGTGAEGDAWGPA